MDTDVEYLPAAAVTQVAAPQSSAPQPAAVQPIPPLTGTQISAPWTAAPPPSADRFTSLAPDEAQSRLSGMLAMSGISLTGTAPGQISATVTIAGEPNWIVVVVLCLFWLVPGIVYWYVKSRPAAHPLSLNFVATDLGTHIVVHGDTQALERLAPVLAQLPW